MTLLLLMLAGSVIPVEPGESIQNALDGAFPGDTVLVMPGTHTGTGDHLVELTGAHNGVVLLGNTSEPSAVVLSGEGLAGSIMTMDGYGQGPLDSTTVIAGLCFWEGNAGEEPFGGAVYTAHASPLLESCLFSGNNADNGGAVYCWKGAPVIRSCVFQGNVCQSAGGGIYLYSSDAWVEDCRFQDNTSWDDGGGIYCYHSSPVIFNCLFTGGYAHDDGGGVYCYALSDPEVAFCTFQDNFALYTGSAVYFRVNSSPAISHCIATANQGPAFYIQDGGNPVFSWNCVWGNPDGDYGNLPDPTGTSGNISQDPLLTGDMFLSHTAAGQAATSPCVDAGGGPSSLYGLDQYWTRTDSIPDSSTVDMGFHHGAEGGFQSGPHEAGPGSFMVCPNPASAAFVIYWSPESGWSTLEVYDLTGRLVLQEVLDGSGSHTVNTDLLGGNGVYAARLSGTGGCTTGLLTVLR